MNRIIDYRQRKPALKSTYLQNQSLKLFLDSLTELRIIKNTCDSDQHCLSCSFTTPDGSLIYVPYSKEWIVDIDAEGIDSANNRGGRLDGMVLAEDEKYNVFAFADENGDEAGFGILQEPNSTFQCGAAAIGAQITLTNLTNAYRFTPGARIAIKPTIFTEWNEAVISTIDSATQITAQTSNLLNSTAITAQAVTGGEIRQVNSHHPYIPDTQDLYYPYYRLVAQIETTVGTNPTISAYSPFEGENQRETGWIHPMTYYSTPVGSWAPNASGNYVTGGVSNSVAPSPANGDRIIYRLHLGLGAYNLYVQYNQFSAGGIALITVDQEPVGTVDMFGNPRVNNLVANIFPVAIREPGQKQIGFTANGTSGANYRLELHGFEFRRIV